MTEPLDRLYDLLPYVYRQRDSDHGEALRALLRVIAEQVNLVEADIDQLYNNWFIETCEDWVVPYIGDLLGYTPVHEAGEPGDARTPRQRQLNKILIPRREVAKTIGYRRRKGALALLEQLANDVAGWPARAVEFYTRLNVAQPINHIRSDRGRTVDLRDGNALALLDGPFDTAAHSVDVRRINSQHARGLYNIPSVGVFVWRLREYPVTEAPASCLEEVGRHCYTFNVLATDTPLYARAQPEPDPPHIATEDNLPVPIRRRAFEKDVQRYYGPGKSMQIWVGKQAGATIQREYVEPQRILVANLTDWKKYRTPRGKVAIDPRTGRILFRPGDEPAGVWVSYHYGFSAEMGGGEYPRPIQHPFDPNAPSDSQNGYAFFTVSEKDTLTNIEDALKEWYKVRAQKPHAVIEITDNSVYSEQLSITLRNGESLQIRAANRTRPTIYLLDRKKNRPDALTVTGEDGGCFTLDGLLVTGRGIYVQGKLAEMNIRHCTLVPGWSLHHDCEPTNPTEASLELYQTEVVCNIEHSILGSIEAFHDNVLAEPIRIRLSDSILDATDPSRVALSDPEESFAHVRLTVERSTVIGRVITHAIDLVEDSIFTSRVTVARRQIGCMCFCYVPAGSRTPQRYRCQPDEAEKVFAIGDDERAAERLRVHPQFNSLRYGTPTYCQLANLCADEIKRGASDRSEMGAFHDLYQPQRESNLRTRLDEYTPAGMSAGIIFAS